MARDFNGTDQFITVSAAVISGTPFSVFCRFNLDALRNGQGLTLISIQDKDVTGDQHMILVFPSDYAIVAERDKLGAISRITSVGTFQTSISGSTVGTGAWRTAAGVWASATSRLVYLDGVAGTENTTSVSPAGIDSVVIGRLGDSTPNWHFDGKISECGVWNVAFAAADILNLHNGAPIASYRTTNLIGYWPLWGVASPEPDLSGKLNNGTVTGAVLANHSPTGPYAGQSK